MMWPSIAFNLIMGLVYAGFLLRAVRRYERTADAILAKIDLAEAESDRKYELARDEIKASLRDKVDRAIAEMHAMYGHPEAAARDLQTSSNVSEFPIGEGDPPAPLPKPSQLSHVGS